MSPPTAPHRVSPGRADYGLDAPVLVARLLAVGAGALGVGLIELALGWPGGLLGALAAGSSFGWALYGLGLGGFVVYASRVAKPRRREALLDLLPWAGAESVLDVGCGRGFLLLGAAARVPAGRAVGVDLWRAADQAGNRPELTLANARLEGVAPWVSVVTADMRELPFDPESFDAVLSHWAVHNVPTSEGRARALREMARVLRPGGHLMVVDTKHRAEYAREFARLGLVGVRVEEFRPRLGRALGLLTFGHFRPAAVVARKPPA